MERTEIAALHHDAAAYSGKTITVCGWARTIRDSKNLGFIDLNDGSSFKGVQIVFEQIKSIISRRSQSRTLAPPCA